MDFEPRWQWADMSPSWARWLPCAVHTLRVVPHPRRFPRRLWDGLPEQFEWHAPAWCDPGDLDDWIANATAGHGPGEEDIAARHAREHYDARVQLRDDRIAAFTRMCRRVEITPPATVAQLLECLIGLDLYAEEHEDGETWLLPRLWRNPLDVLPLTLDEAAQEAGNQQTDRAMLAGAGLRRLVVADHPATDTGDALTVTVTLRAIGEAAGLHPGQVRPALSLLDSGEALQLGGVDLDATAFDSPLPIQLPWPHFAQVFDFDHLPAPEHLP